VEISQTIIADEKAAISNAIEQFVAARLITLNKETGEQVYWVDEDRRLKLDYFKNGSVHFFASIGVVSTLILKQKSTTMEKLESDFEACRNVLRHEFRFATRMPVAEHLRKITDFLASRNAIRMIADRIELNEGGADILAAFSGQIQNFFESIKVALAALKRQKMDTADERDLIKAMIATGKNMLLLGHIHHREAISKANFQNAIHLIREQDISNLQVQLERLL
jgi:glycerol-3-phosphate O-acyltransferase